MKAHELIATRETYSGGVYAALTATGKSCRPRATEATEWSGLGALHHCYEGAELRSVKIKLWAEIAKLNRFEPYSKALEIAEWEQMVGYDGVLETFRRLDI